MTTNSIISLAREVRDTVTYFELKIGRQVVASAPLPRGTSDAVALAFLLDSLPR